MEQISRRAFSKNALMAAGAAALGTVALTHEPARAHAAGSGYLKLFCDALDAQSLVYTVKNDYKVLLRFGSDYVDEVDVYVLFDEDGGNDVALRCWSIYKYDQDDLIEGYTVCNELNNEYRWVTFSVDSDNEVAATIDTLVCENCCGESLVELTLRMAGIVDECYPRFDPTIEPVADDDSGNGGNKSGVASALSALFGA